MDLLAQPWPWFVAGPLIGLFVPVLLLVGNKCFGFSINLRHLCAAALLTVRGLVLVVGGGFLVGFGTAYAGGCTSGHAISGLADFQFPSLLAVVGFFAGGLIATHVLLPLLF